MEPYESQVKPFIKEGRESRDQLQELVTKLVEIVDSIQAEVNIRPPLRESDVLDMKARMAILSQLRIILGEAQVAIDEEADIDKWDDIVNKAVDKANTFLGEQKAKAKKTTFIEGLERVFDNEMTAVQKGHVEAYESPNRLDIFEVTPRMKRTEETINTRLGKLTSGVKGDITKLLEESQGLETYENNFEGRVKTGLDLYLGAFEEKLRLEKLIKDLEGQVPEDRMKELNLESLKQEILASPEYKERIAKIKRDHAHNNLQIDPNSPQAKQQYNNQKTLRNDELERVDSDAKEAAETKLKELIDGLLTESGVSPENIAGLRDRLDLVEEDLRELEQYLESLIDIRNSIRNAVETLKIAEENTPEEDQEEEVGEDAEASEESEEENSEEEAPKADFEVDSATLIELLGLGDWSDVRSLLTRINVDDPMDLSIDQIAREVGVKDFEMKMFALINKYEQDEDGEEGGDDDGDGAPEAPEAKIEDADADADADGDGEADEADDTEAEDTDAEDAEGEEEAEGGDEAEEEEEEKPAPAPKAAKKKTRRTKRQPKPTADEADESGDDDDTPSGN